MAGCCCVRLAWAHLFAYQQRRRPKIGKAVVVREDKHTEGQSEKWEVACRTLGKERPRGLIYALVFKQRRGRGDQLP